jgi:hypothetical protein
MPKSEVIIRNLQREYLRSRGWKMKQTGFAGERWYRPSIRDIPRPLKVAYDFQRNKDEEQRNAEGTP